MAIYTCNRTLVGEERLLSHLISLSLNESLRQRGKTSPEKTDRGYDLRSRGPATLGLDALDIVLLPKCEGTTAPKRFQTCVSTELPGKNHHQNPNYKAIETNSEAH